MGFKYDDRAIKCPLFMSVLKTTNEDFVGIQCENSELNLGFDVIELMRFKTFQDLKEYTWIYCQDCYTACQQYKKYCCENKEVAERKKKHSNLS